MAGLGNLHKDVSVIKLASQDVCKSPFSWLVPDMALSSVSQAHVHGGRRVSEDIICEAWLAEKLEGPVLEV